MLTRKGSLNKSRELLPDKKASYKLPFKNYYLKREKGIRLTWILILSKLSRGSIFLEAAAAAPC